MDPQRVNFFLKEDIHQDINSDFVFSRGSSMEDFLEGGK